MFVFLITITTIASTSALKPAENVEQANDKIQNIINKYLTKIPDIEEQYIVDERLSAAISRIFKGKISSFPLYRISLKIDRNPVKIPWTLGDAKFEEPYVKDENRHVQKQYKYQQRGKDQDVRTIKLYGDLSKVNSMKAVTKINNRSSKPSGITVNYGGESPNLDEGPDTSKNTKNIDATKMPEPEEPNNGKIIQSAKMSEELDKKIETAKLSEERNIVKNKDVSKMSEEAIKSKNIQSLKMAEEHATSKHMEAAKSSEVSVKSKNIESSKLYTEPDKNENIIMTTDSDDLVGETTEATTIIKLA